MGKLAVWNRAIGSITAHRHARMFEWTAWVRAVWEKLALLLRLMRLDQRRTGMPASTFGILAGCAETAGICHIKGHPFRSCRRLVDVGASLVRTS